MEAASYILAWCVYLVSATGLTSVFWRMTRNLTLRRTRRSLRTLVAVLLFTPININIDTSELWLAPAYLVGTYDWILGNQERAAQAGVFIAIAYMLMMVIIMLESVLRRLFGMDTAR